MTNPPPPRIVTAYDRVWVDCVDCGGGGMLDPFSSTGTECPLCASQGGWFTSPPTIHPEPGASHENP